MSELAERIEILRRVGERGLELAQKGCEPPAALQRGWYNDREAGAYDAHEAHLDLWQHLLDELKLVTTGDER